MANNSLWSLLLLILLIVADCIAVSKVCRSGRTNLVVVLWTLLIFFFPVGGLLIWFLAGPREHGAPPPVQTPVG